MKLIFIRGLLFLMSLFSMACADESMDSSAGSNETNSYVLAEQLRARQLDNKILFLQTYYNSSGDQVFKEPYPYAVDYKANILVRRMDGNLKPVLSIAQPPVDCNGEGTSCSQVNGLYTCETTMTLMGCNYKNDLTEYYRIPDAFSIEVVNGYAVITEAGNSSKAIVKILNSSQDLPPYNPPNKILQSFFRFNSDE